MDHRFDSGTALLDRIPSQVGVQAWNPLTSGRAARWLGATLAALCLAAALPSLGLAQDAPADDAASGDTVVAGYTAAQARKGTALYRDDCAGCHGTQLEGYQESPPLKGPDFEAQWFGGPVADLFDFISTNMPMTDPGSLKPEEYAALVAYLLKEYGVKAGKDEFPSDTAEMANMVMPSADN